jgi:protein-S-isoprenylcysteine O-methyltransferase Ste14
VSDRGTGWVIAQFALIGACFLAALVPPDWPARARGVLTVLGAVLALAGVLVAVAAARALGRGLTPFPRPLPGASLVATGPYRVVRHPIYSGGLLFFLGWSLYAGPAALVVTLALAVLWAGKTAVEERHLRSAHPSYAAYAEHVRFRLVPGVW